MGMQYSSLWSSELNTKVWKLGETSVRQELLPFLHRILITILCCSYFGQIHPKSTSRPWILYGETVVPEYLVLELIRNWHKTVTRTDNEWHSHRQISSQILKNNIKIIKIKSLSRQVSAVTSLVKKFANPPFYSMGG